MVFCFVLSIVPLQLAKAPHSSNQTATTSVDDVDWWLMFHHYLNHSGFSSSSGPTTNHPLWSYTTGDSVESSPAVADGRVYVGSWDGKAYCLDASTGAFIWSYATGSDLRSLTITTLLFCLKSIPFS